MTADISVLIVNYNTADFTAQCLKSLKAQQKVSFEVFVYDNDSSDNSVEIISEFDWVTLIESNKNVGFAKANNQLISKCTGNLIYFLNPDTEMPQKDCLKKICQFMDNNPLIGLAGTRLQYPDGSQQSSYEKSYPGERYARSELTGLPGKTAWLLGASIVARREVVEQVQGFDERFFLYGEDLDLSLSVRKKGWKLGVIENVSITHWEGQSEKGSPSTAVLTKKLTAEMIFYEKHYSAKVLLAIRRANIRQALWRIFTLKVALFLGLNVTKNKSKLTRYKMIKKFFSQ